MLATNPDVMDASRTFNCALTADLNTLRFSRVYAGFEHFCGIIDDQDASDGDDSGNAVEYISWSLKVIMTRSEKDT